jgi:hypothetical protein
MTAPSSLDIIRNKVRRITGRPNQAEITDAQIDDYINTFYIYDMNEQLRIESFRYNWQFITNANQPVYDFPTDSYLTTMPPIYIGGYQSYLTQSRENFFRINPQLNYIQTVGLGPNPAIAGPFTFTLTNIPIIPGFKPNPPGAYNDLVNLAPNLSPIPVASFNWNVLVSSTSQGGQTMALVDDGLGNLWDPTDSITDLSVPPGTVDYQTGVVNFTFPLPVGPGKNINVQSIPYSASRPQTAVFYQDQIILYPVPDQAYTVSFEAYKYPSIFLSTEDPTLQNPQLKEMWQLLAYGAADKIFSDNGDVDNMMKYRPLLEEQFKFVQRRTIVQQTSERTASIYSEMTGIPHYGFGNNFAGF